MKLKPNQANRKPAGRKFRSGTLGKPFFKRLAHPELIVLRRQNSESMFTVSETLALLTALLLALIVVYLFAGCAGLRQPKGGRATLLMAGGGKTNQATLVQPDNPKQSSRQKLTTEQTYQYVLPTGTELSLPSENPAYKAVARLCAPTPVTVKTCDSAESVIGSSYRDTSRAVLAHAAQLRPVIWAGIAMLTLVPGALLYFGWPTKAALSAGIGVGMITLAAALPSHGTLILVGGLAVFGVAALLVLYSYHKGQADTHISAAAKLSRAS